MKVDVGGCPRDVDFRTSLLEACGSEFDDVGVGWGKDIPQMSDFFLAQLG